MADNENYRGLAAGSDQLVALLVQENMGWAQAIARSVARAWNLDWQLDGLDGGAYEALLFCARRFDPTIGVPFRAYARKRIHESSTDEARKSKAWQRGVGSGTGDPEAREISFRLLELFPELREGSLPDSGEDGEERMRSSIRQLLSSASMLSTFNDCRAGNPESAIEYKQMLRGLAELEPIHQAIIWGIYWNGQSMRNIAEEWEIDELTVIREHREILRYVHERMINPKAREQKRLKIRPSLRGVALRLRKKKVEPPFAKFTDAVLGGALLFFIALKLYGAMLNDGRFETALLGEPLASDVVSVYEGGSW